MNKEDKECITIIKGLVIINRISIIIRKILGKEKITENEKKIIEGIIKMEGLDKK